MDLGLKDRVAVVLASSSGLGLAVAESLLDEGARVAVSGRDGARVTRALEGLRRRHAEGVWGESLDVRDRAALARHIASVHERWGRVDVLVTNAGGPPPGPAFDADEASLRAAYELTFESAVTAIRAVLPGMRERGWGRIIAMTSIAVRQPVAGLALSNAMRAGLTGYLKSLADEVARDGVLVNSVCTGMFETERLQKLFEARAQASGRTPEEERARTAAEIPVGRIGHPAEFGSVVAFLASEQASYLNGVALALDGGAGRGLL